MIVTGYMPVQHTRHAVTAVRHPFYGFKYPSFSQHSDMATEADKANKLKHHHNLDMITHNNFDNSLYR